MPHRRCATCNVLCNVLCNGKCAVMAVPCFPRKARKGSKDIRVMPTALSVGMGFIGGIHESPEFITQDSLESFQQ